MRTLQHLMRACALAAAGLALGVSQAWSAEVWLEARPLGATEYPAGIPSSVPMWGYAFCGNGPAQGTCGAASVPGPQLVVPVGDTSLTIHLKNSLPAALSVPNMTSIVIPGQREDAMAPVMFSPEPNPHGAGQPDRVRMRSFTHETLQGQIGDYIWSNLKPGTYLYHSGTHAQVQVQMGLYGSVQADAVAGQAYVGQAYDSQATLLFSEIDPLLHTEVANSTYGTPGHPTSTISYQPKYFLMNGAPYSISAAPIAVGPPGQRVLLRLLNAGLESHVPTLLGGRFQIIAEDGNVLAHSRDQYETLLPAGKTMDAIWVPATSETYSIYDRRNRQGLLAKLQVAAAPPTANNDTYSTPAGTALSVAAPGVLANDTNPTATPMTAALVTGPASGTLALNANGSFTYTPAAGFIGQTSFTYRANNGLDSNVATVTITVLNRPPTAGNDAVTTAEDTAAVIAAATLLANDSDPDGQPLTMTSVGGAVNGTVALAGTTITFTPTANFNGAASFTYTISDGQGGTATATVAVTVTPVNDLPVAGNDAVTTPVNTAAVIAAATLLANDSDVDGNPLTITSVGGAVNGTVALAGTTVTFTPTANFSGAASFTYTISDSQGGTATATVTVTVTASAAGTVTGFVLRNAANEQVIVASLTNGATIDLATLCGNCQVNLQALTSPLTITGGSVRLVLSGATSSTRNDNNNPYTLPNATGNPINYAGIRLNAGLHTLTATPYSGPDATGIPGTPLTMTFTVAGPSVTGLILRNATTDTLIGPLTNGMTVSPAACNNCQFNIEAVVSGTVNNVRFALTGTTTGSNNESLAPYTFPGDNGVGNYNGVTLNLGAHTITATPFISTGASGVPLTVSFTVANTSNPVATNDAYSTPAGTVLTVAAPGVLANDANPTATPLTAALVTGPASGTLTLNANGSFTYTPTAGFTGQTSFTYQASNGTLSNVATVTLTVTSTTPTATNDAYSTPAGTALTVAAPGVLANDANPTATPLTAALVTGPASGTLTLNANGSFTYTPAAGFTGQTSFTYQASNGTLSNVATVTLTVTSTTGPTVTGFILRNATTDTLIGPLTSGTVVSLAACGNCQFNIEAVVSGTASNVRFALTGATTGSNNEGLVPYTFPGDAGVGNYNGVTLNQGVHAITATPFTSTGASGTPLSVSFTVGP